MSTSNEQRFFWVNHKKTVKTEVEKGFIWAPKTKVNGHKNETYSNLKKVRVGDVIFSYANLKIGAVGTATSNYYDFDKPDEFRSATEEWIRDGWKVDVEFNSLKNPIIPKDKIESILPLLPSKYSPIQGNGNGNESCYLACISPKLGKHLLELCEKMELIIPASSTTLSTVEKDIADINNDKEIPQTEKEALIKARIGQGKFRKDVLELYPECPVTGVSMSQLLIASHIKPWRKCDNKERLDPNNGIMLAPHIDALFDKGFISFNDDGKILIKSYYRSEVNKLGLNLHSANIKENSIKYLSWHREYYKFNKGDLL